MLSSIVRSFYVVNGSLTVETDSYDTNQLTKIGYLNNYENKTKVLEASNCV